MNVAPDARVERGSAPPARRLVRWLRVLAALLLGLVLALVAVEVAFRLFWTLPPWFAEFQQAGMYVATPRGGVGLRPGYRGTLQIGDGIATTVRVDARGLRGPERGELAAGERRVLVVGDSLVFGYGVDDEHALPARLEHALRGLGVAVRVDNGGVSSFGVSHAVARLAELDATGRADAFLVCGFLGNDAVDEAMPRRVVDAGLLLQGSMAKLVQTSWRTRLALRSRAWLWVEAWILTNAPARSPLGQVVIEPDEAARVAGLPPEGQRHAGLFLDADDAPRASPVAPEVVQRLLGYLRDALARAKAAASGRPLVFVVLPTLWQVDEARRVARLRELGFDPAQFPRGKAQERWSAIALELGVPALDATPVLAAQRDPAGLFLADGGHLSERGNEVVGRWLAEQLVARVR
jgi:lysophospholipase L1-like esterase